MPLEHTAHRVELGMDTLHIWQRHVETVGNYLLLTCLFARHNSGRLDEPLALEWVA